MNRIFNTKFKDLKIIKIKTYKDKRGELYFGVVSNKIKKKFIYDYTSVSKKNVFRGFHFQQYPFTQEKFIRVLNGKILDILISIDKNSKNYLKAFYFELSDKNKRILYVPKKFAHGFLVLSKNATIEYFVTNYYSKENERSINIFDERLKINKKITQKKLIMSAKDKTSNF